MNLEYMDDVEKQILELYRNLEPYERMEITKRKGETRIDIHRAIFIAERQDGVV
jgi:hypothetical protein